MPDNDAGCSSSAMLGSIDSKLGRVSFFKFGQLGQLTYDKLAK